MLLAGIQKNPVMDKIFYIYILASKKNGTLYVGITSDLPKRIFQHKHKHKLIKGFSNKYDINKLVYYEIYKDSVTAITREKRLKKWKRQWKIRLILKKKSHVERFISRNRNINRLIGRA
jgi:putative endonuclease